VATLSSYPTIIVGINQYVKEGLKYFGERTLSQYKPAASSGVQQDTSGLSSVEKGFCLVASKKCI